MGNQTQKPIQVERKPPKQLAPAKLITDITCPNCFLTFPKDSLLQKFSTHMKMCLAGCDPEKQATMKQSIKKMKEENFFYEKVFDDDENIQYSWKKTSYSYFDDDIWKLEPHEVKNSSFQEKLAWFRSNLEKYRISWEDGCDWMKIDKNNSLMTSIEAVKFVDMWRQIKIEFIGEEVLDAGGLLREWIHLLTQQIFDSSLGLFKRANTNELVYKISNQKSLDREFAQEMFGLIGTVIGKAIFQKIPLQAYIDRTIIRQLCGQQIVLSDIHTYDKGLYDSWKYLLDSTIDEDMDIYFTITQKISSSLRERQLVEDGKNKQVTNENKQIYVNLCIQQYCIKQLKPFVSKMKENLHKIIPQRFLSVFQPNQIQMILYGVPFINVDDWRDNTQYRGAYTKNHRTIRWFWEILKSLQQEKLAKLLHFCTGSSRTPIRGFAKLQTNRGSVGKFVIQSSLYEKSNPFPKGHTCFNRLELPVYPTRELTQTYVSAIVNNNLDGVYGLE